MQTIQIVPQLPPFISGVGDYAFLLAKQLRAAHDIHTVFVVCDPEWGNEENRKQKVERAEAKSEIGGFSVHRLRKRSSEELLRVLSQPGMPQTVLLHYVGYGYEKRGCPVWLVHALRAWRNGGRWPEVGGQKSVVSDPPQRRLVTMFHELYAFGPPWRSSFWTSPLQRLLAKALARGSDHCFTNRAASATWLASTSQHLESAISTLPVFSTVGEPELLTDWNQRPTRLIVFGQASQRRRVYFEHRTDLDQTCEAMNLTEVIDIGAPFEIPQLAVPVSQRGILSAEEVSQEMLSARAGFFAYPTAYLAKSTIFAAYAAHGLAPVTFSVNRVVNGDNLKAGEHYLSIHNLGGYVAGTIGQNANGWYQKHSLKVQAERYARIIKSLTSATLAETKMANV